MCHKNAYKKIRTSIATHRGLARVFSGLGVRKLDKQALYNFLAIFPSACRLIFVYFVVAFVLHVKQL